MSAITGIYYLDDQRVERLDLERMLETISHRGSDGVGVWSQGSVGLGHRMLWTTPESLLEKLPLVNQTGDIAITADARIDNRDELIAILALNDYPSEKITDSQLILAAYEKWGEECQEFLLGDFAFAIWDGRKQVLFCARDHFGVKPFYYYSSSQVFIFATEIKALLCLPEVPRQLNEVKVADYLTSVCDDTTDTFYQGIFRLPAAHSMTVSHAGTRLQSYWSLDPARELRLGSDEEYAEAFRELFTEAVRCRLRSAFPVGSMLSGGLDSSAITCVARKLRAENGGQPLPTFSAIFDEVTQCDERFFINAVLAQNGLQPNYVHGDQVSPLTDLDRVHWHLDEAIFSGNLFLLWALQGAAKEQGVRILLDGFDGDTTVSHGTGYLIELARSGRWITLLKEARAYAPHFNISPRKLLRWYVWHHGLKPVLQQIPQPVRRIGRSLYPRTAPTNQSQLNILNPDFVQRIGLEERRRTQALAQPSQPLSEREVHYRRLTMGVMSFILEVNDRAAAAFSIEKRYPFWDKRLVEFCLALPPEQKLNRGWIRMVMRRAMAGILPEEVQWRGGKGNMSPNFEHGLLTFDREQLEEVILKDPGAIGKYVDITALRKAYHRFVSREATEQEVFSIWQSASLALWLQSTGLTP